MQAQPQARPQGYQLLVSGLYFGVVGCNGLPFGVELFLRPDQNLRVKIVVFYFRNDEYGIALVYKLPLAHVPFSDLPRHGVLHILRAVLRRKGRNVALARYVLLPRQKHHNNQQDEYAHYPAVGYNARAGGVQGLKRVQFTFQEGGVYAVF